MDLGSRPLAGGGMLATTELSASPSTQDPNKKSAQVKVWRGYSWKRDSEDQAVESIVDMNESGASCPLVPTSPLTQDKTENVVKMLMQKSRLGGQRR